MVEAKEDRLAREIYESVGGMMNVSKVMHCMTRVRLSIIDKQRVQLEQLKAIDGVMGIVEDDSLQIVVGPGTVNKVAQKMAEMAGVKLGEEIVIKADDSTAALSDREKVEAKAAAVKAEQKKKNNTPFKQVLKRISNIFVPLIPAFVGAGLIGGIASIFQNMLTAGTISGENWLMMVTVLGVIKSGIFAYLVIYVGINSANEFDATPSLGGIIGGTTMLTWMNPDLPIKNIFTGEPLSAGYGGVIGVIFAVWLLSLVEKRLHKMVPDSIDIIVTPTLTLLILG